MAKWIIKANDDVLSFCKCEHPLASLPGQLDCPWCGCGYLISCSFCRKAFTFGAVVTIDHSVRDLIASDRERGGYHATDADLSEDASAIEELLGSFSDGDTLVYLDGCYFTASERNVRFDGLYARHDLLVLPHQLARSELAGLNDTVGQQSYWLERALDEGT